MQRGRGARIKAPSFHQKVCLLLWNRAPGALLLNVQSALGERYSQALPDSSLSPPSLLKEFTPFCQKEAHANSYIQAPKNT